MIDRLFQEIIKEVDYQLTMDKEFIITTFFLRSRFRIGKHRAYLYLMDLRILGYSIDNKSIDE